MSITIGSADRYQSHPCAVISALDDCVNSCHIIVLLYWGERLWVWTFALHVCTCPPPVWRLSIRLCTGLLIRFISLLSMLFTPISVEMIYVFCGFDYQLSILWLDVDPTVLEPVPRTICLCDTWAYGYQIVVKAKSPIVLWSCCALLLDCSNS